MVSANKSSARTADSPPPKLPIGVRIPSMIKVSFKVIICCKNKEFIPTYRGAVRLEPICIFHQQAV
jgi:hypothetical protein